MTTINDLLASVYMKVHTRHESLDIYALGQIDSWQIDLVHLKANQTYPAHIHDESYAKLLVMQGCGTISINGVDFSYKQKDTFQIPPKTSHGFKPVEDTFLLSLQNPPIIQVKGQIQSETKIDLRYVGE